MSSRTEKYEKADGSSGYDALNRLTNVDYGDGQTQAYTFDAMGNRLQRQDSASGTTNSTVDAANRLTGTTGAGASTYANDADGNTLTGGGRTNAWDSQNRMVSCTITGNSSTFKYGADGLRRQKTTNGITTDFAYDGTMLVREGHATGGSLTPATVTATYFQGASGPCYRRDDTAFEIDSQNQRVTKARWYVYDGLGSVVGEMDPLGDLTSSPKYDVYGATRSNGGTASSKQGFVGSLGHVSDDTGLVYMRARFYDPNLGRFASEDPSEHGNNWFIYCNGNPVNAVDQNGKESGPLDFFTAAILAMGTGILVFFASQTTLAGLVDRLGRAVALGTELAELCALATVIAAAMVLAGCFCLGIAIGLMASAFLHSDLFAINMCARAAQSIHSSIVGGFPAGEAMAIASLEADSHGDSGDL